MNGHSKFLHNKALFEDLKSYLEDKRESLKEALIASVALPDEWERPLLEPPESISLLKSVTIFEDTWQLLSLEKLSRLKEDRIISRMIAILTNYVDMLEGMARELFNQLKAVPIDTWNQDLYDRLESTKVFLWDKLQEVDKFIKALEVSLKKLKYKCLSNRSYQTLKRAKFYFFPIFGHELAQTIYNSELFLHDNFRNFSRAFIAYKKAASAFVSDHYKYQGYIALGSHEDAPQDRDEKSFYRRLSLYLKLWSLKKFSKSSYAQDLIRSIKQLYPSGLTALKLRAYINHIKKHVFSLAKEIRRKKDSSVESKIYMYRMEVSALFTILINYRQFLLSEDKHLSKRKLASFLGLKKLSYKLETRKTKEFLELGKEVEKIDLWLFELLKAQKKEIQNTDSEISQKEEKSKLLILSDQFQAINKILKDMSQPLISRELMQEHSQKLIDKTLELNELTAPLEEISDLVLELLLKAFKYDAKYKTLIQGKNFWSVWEVHQGFSLPKSTFQYDKRVKLYKTYINHLSHWISDRSLNAHKEALEHEIHDINEALQEFYRLCEITRDKEEKLELKKQLLEDRVFFSRLMLFLKKHPSETKHLINDLSFFDKYFDAIHDKIFEN